MLDFKWNPELAREVEMEEAIEDARDEGRAEGERNEKLNNLRSLLKNTNFSVEQAMSALGIELALRKEYMALL